MNILFVGAFDRDKKSTNTSQLISFKKLNHNVVGYDYRKKAAQIGNDFRDQDLINIIKKRNFDLVLYSKCNVISPKVFKESSKYSKTCLWFMDAMVNYTKEMQNKTSLVDYVCCDKPNVLDKAKSINSNSFLVYEGFDEDVDQPHDLKKEYEVSFIGSIYGDRQDTINRINREVKIITNAFGTNHAIEVSKSKINLNFCTTDGASDRVYKIMAAGGLLFTNDWSGRETMFEDKKDCVIFEDVEDLNSKIDFYLNNPELGKKIALSGLQTVQKYNRESWAKNIIKFANEI